METPAISISSCCVMPVRYDLSTRLTPSIARLHCLVLAVSGTFSVRWPKESATKGVTDDVHKLGMASGSVACSFSSSLMKWSLVLDLMVRLLGVDFCGICDEVGERGFAGRPFLCNGAVAGARHSPLPNDAGA